MIFPAVDSFCECVMFRILGIFREYTNVRGPGEGIAVGRWLVAVGQGLLTSHAQR